MNPITTTTTGNGPIYTHVAIFEAGATDEQILSCLRSRGIGGDGRVREQHGMVGLRAVHFAPRISRAHQSPTIVTCLTICEHEGQSPAFEAFAKDAGAIS